MRRGLLAAAVACVWLCARPASAQTSDSPEYRVAVATGLQEFERGNYSEARAAFARAHAIYPNARTLRGMGLSAFESRSYVAASELLRAALANGQRPLDEGQRRELQGVLERAESNIAQVTLALAPAGALLAIDGERRTLPPDGVLRLDPGEHRLEANAAGYRPQQLTLSVEAGQAKTIELTLLADRQMALAGANPRRDGSGGRAELLPWLVIGGGGALLAASAVTGLLTSSAEDELRRSCDRGACDESVRERGKSLQLATNVLLPVGGAALATGVLLLYLRREGDGDHSQAGARRGAWLTLGCAAGGCAAAWQGAF